MRIILLFLIGFSLALPLVAQEFSETTPDVDIQIKKSFPVSNTNMVIQTEGAFVTMNTGATIVVSSSTNKSADSKLLFLVDTGIQYTEEGEHEEAERAYLRALERDPDNSAIRFRLGTLYIMMNRYTEAVPILKALVDEFPENSQVRNNLAWCYATGEGVRDQKKALFHAREAILSAPISPSMWNTLAEAYYMGGDYEKAERSAEHAIDLLIQTDPKQTQMPDFQAQLQKIQRAAQVLRRFQGLDDDE